jgi:CubicO group peptidase (beta-lactamase class C family)
MTQQERTTATTGATTTACILSFALAASLQAQVPQARVDSIFAGYNASTPGCAVAVADGAQTVFAKGYGMASLEHDVSITPATPFYAASVSKQFTAFAVALLAQQGKLSLDDDVRKWLPEVPDFGKTITVRHLIHHTSGLRDYFGLLGMTGWPSDGPITEAQFLDLVSRQKALNFAPGTRHLYSNTGYVLLSILVKRVSGKSLREFADEAMFKPLGMSNTQFRDDHRRLVKNRALAYAPAAGGTWQMSVPGFDVVGDGGLFTTAEDLARWARNYNDRTVGADGVSALVLTRGRLNAGDSIPYAFGITHGSFRGLPTLEHGGAYGGYRTHLMHFPTQRFSVAMLCNAGNVNAASLSQRVAAAFLGDRLAPVTQTAASALTAKLRLSADELARYTGAYWDDTNETMRRVEVRDSTVVVNGMVFLPVAEHRFQSRTANISLRFTPGPSGSWRLEETAPSGDKLVYQRMTAPSAEASALSAYTANYYSPELDTTWRIEVKDGRLIIKRRALPDQPIDGVFLDAFQTPAGVLRFTRENGRITGFVVGAGRVTGFRFDRVMER